MPSTEKKKKQVLAIKKELYTVNYLACENIRFSPLFAAGSPAAKSEEKRMFSQAINYSTILVHVVH